ncbi:MAG: hypothetical protein ACYCYQ_01705 [Acidimicrobiales bacterium]
MDPVQVTPSSDNTGFTEESGRSATVQVVPESVSTTGTGEVDPAVPTATQEVDAAQVTPSSVAVVFPEGIGRSATVQVVPESVSSTGTGEVDPAVPTATQEVDAAQEMSVSRTPA